MEFFDILGKKASEAYKFTADKTGKIAKETKIKLKMTDLKSQVEDLYEEIGKKVYENHVREEKLDIHNQIDELCIKIDVISDEIEDLLQECLELKDKKQCSNCYTEIEKQDKFCRYCGEKQTDEPPKEVEVLEKLQNTNVEDDEEIEKQMVMEDLKNDIQEKEKQEVVSEDNDEVSQDEQYEENLKKTVAIEVDSNLEDNESEEEIIKQLRKSQEEDAEM